MSTTIWAFLGSLMIHGQNFLVYPLGYAERPPEVHEPTAIGIPFEDLRLATSDRVTVACHLMLFSEFNARRSSSSMERGMNAQFPVAGRATVVMFHGNAMTHGDLIELAAEFLGMGCNVLTVSYRGYGHSTGKPSESGLRIDAQTALDYLVQHPTLSSVPIIVFGQSLGGAVAIDLVSRNCDRVSALVLENTFLSIPALVRGWPSPIGPLSFLCTQRWPSIDRIRNISRNIPILMLSGDRDVIVPPKHMQGLWLAAKARSVVEDPEPTCSPFFLCSGARCKGKKKASFDVEKAVAEDMASVKSPASIWNGKDLFQYFSGRGHEDTSLDEAYWLAVRTFLDQLDLPPPQP